MKIAGPCPLSSFLKYVVLVAAIASLSIAPSHAETFDGMLSQMRILFDDIENITYLSDKAGGNIELVLQTRSRPIDMASKFQPLLIMNYITSMSDSNAPSYPDTVVFNADGDVYTLSGLTSRNTDTRFDYPSTFVKITVTPDDDMIRMLKQIAGAGRVKVRFKDDHRAYDTAMSASDIMALRRMLKFYEEYQNGWPNTGSGYNDDVTPENEAHYMLDKAINPDEFLGKIARGEYLEKGREVTFESGGYGPSRTTVYIMSEHLSVQTLTNSSATYLIRMRAQLRVFPKLRKLIMSLREVAERYENGSFGWADTGGDAAYWVTVKDGALDELLYDGYGDIDEPEDSYKFMQ